MRKNHTYSKKNKVEEKEKIEKNKYKQRYLPVFLLLIAIIILLGISPLFNISKINVFGVNYYSDEDIIKVSGIVEGVNGFKNVGGGLKNFFFLRYGQAETDILNKCPYIKDVVVKYNLPNKVAIHIKEREPYVIIPYIGAYLVLDGYGHVLETVDDREKYSIPFIKGLKFTNYEIGQALEIENNRNFEKLLILIDALTEEEKNDNFKLIDNIDIIDVSDINNIHMFIDSRLVVNIGDLYELNYRIRALKQIINKNIGEDEKGMLDFTAGDYPVFIPAE
jgi:cell division protein FtsQ